MRVQRGARTCSSIIVHPSSLNIMARKSILVVDDERPQREAYERTLSAAGFDVTTATSGEAAVKVLADREFDLAIPDLKMAGMTGNQLLQHVVAMDRVIPVILISGHGTIETAKEALRHGA